MRVCVAAIPEVICEVPQAQEQLPTTPGPSCQVRGRRSRVRSGGHHRPGARRTWPCLPLPATCYSKCFV